METLALTNIQPIGNEVAFAWADGSESYLPLEFLRRACPCATCGGEPDVLGNVLHSEVTYFANSFVLRSHQNVGGYGWQPTWADGHTTGIYSYHYLRRLAEVVP
ncbi:MAG TPA: DUF971 domain-containing protein [Chthoniobacterales bacterium]|jgi:DUF971 family protein